MATYTVIADTHGYPWGKPTADFDLGDNTPSYDGTFQEAIHPTTVDKKIKLYGNHDVAYLGHSYGEIQEYIDSTNKIAFYGLDTAESFARYRVPYEQILDLAKKMTALPANWNVVVLSHVPLFGYDPLMGACYDYTNWKDNGNSATAVVDLLAEYNAGNSKSFTYYEDLNKSPTTARTITFNFSDRGTGRVIGCFSGHIHNSVKCYRNGIYMEAFMANGGNSFTTNNEQNAGLYIPDPQTININLTAKTVNGYSYTPSSISTGTTVIEVYRNATDSEKYPLIGKSEGNVATGDRNFSGRSETFPKFRKGFYIGFSKKRAGGVASINSNNGWWPVSNSDSTDAFLHGFGKVKYIRFDASGRLRYYSNAKSKDDENFDTSFRELPNYMNATFYLESPQHTTKEEETTVNIPATTWTFKGGLYSGYKNTPVFSYKSGILLGKNGYGIRFGNDGRPTSLTLNGANIADNPGQNWIRLYSLRAYWRGFGDLANNDYTENNPQIGVEGNISGGNAVIDFAGPNGANWIPGRSMILMRVKGENSQIYWLYDGKLTTLTDSIVGI